MQCNFKIKILELFNELKKKLIYILTDENLLFSSADTMKYKKCFNEIIHVFQNTLNNIENIYFKYFLFPKLKNIEKI